MIMACKAINRPPLRGILQQATIRPLSSFYGANLPSSKRGFSRIEPHCKDKNRRRPNVDASFTKSLAESHAHNFLQTNSISTRASSGAQDETIAVECGSSERSVVDILRDRGLVDAVTSEELRKVAVSTQLKAYVGFDPTAESLHLGNLLGIVALAWFQREGHRVVALLGGATARVGDPSGKSAERPMLDEEAIRRNTEGIRATLQGILERDAQRAPASSSSPTFEILNNYDWWKEITLLSFLRDVGKFARVGSMMAKESVKKRLGSEEGMSYTEFTYQLLQGYDFVHLYQQHGVCVQMGGSDQWGNITAGTELVRKLLGGGHGGGDLEGGNGSAADNSTASPPSSSPTVYGLTWPLLLKSDGSKFGKSEGGAIWLSSAMLSPYKFYQYLFATPDADVIPFLRMLTFVDLPEIEALELQMQQEGYLPNTAQRRLAEEVTRFVHGEEGLQEALRATQALAPGAATRLDVASLEAIAEDVPSIVLPLEKVKGALLVDVGVACGLFPSKAAARRTIKQGGAYMNNQKIGEEGRVVEEDDVIGGKMLLLASGKKNKMLVRIL